MSYSKLKVRLLVSESVDYSDPTIDSDMIEDTDSTVEQSAELDVFLPLGTSVEVLADPTVSDIIWELHYLLVHNPDTTNTLSITWTESSNINVQTIPAGKSFLLPLHDSDTAVILEALDADMTVKCFISGIQSAYAP